MTRTPEQESRWKMQNDVIRAACWTVLQEDADGLTQRHIDDLRTMIQAYVWNEAADLIVQKAAHEIVTIHFKSQDDHNGDADADCVDRAGA